MRPASIEDRVREYLAVERERIPVPVLLPQQILRAVESSRPAPSRARLGFLRGAAAMAAMLLLGVGIASIRIAQSPAGLVQGTWSSAPSMAATRGSHTATLLPNGKVLVVGGTGPRLRPVASAELYDPATRKWSSAGTLSAPRSGNTATLLPNGKVLVAGGSEANAENVGSLSSAELYDPKTNSWSAAARMHTPRSFHTATLLADGRVLVVGGIQAFSDITGTVLASTELYDPATNTWTTTAPLATARALHAAVLLADHRALVIGGAVDARVIQPSSSSRTAELYDPASQTWSSAANMQYARVFASANLLPDGRVLVVGDDGINYRTAELFDPTKGRWSPAPDPGMGRAEAATTRLRDGNVLVAGGLGQTSTQVFDWRHNRWSSAGDLEALRASATATLLANGQVLIAGGFGRLSDPWASAELYDPSGRHVAATPRSTSAPALVGGIAPILGAAVLLLGLGLWSVRRRQTLRSRQADIWLD